MSTHLDPDPLLSLRALSKRITQDAGAKRAPHGSGYRSLEDAAKIGALRCAIMPSGARLVRWSWWLEYVERLADRRAEPLPLTVDTALDERIERDVRERIEREQARARVAGSITR